MTATPYEPTPLPAVSKRRTWGEIAIVLAVGLGQSAVYAIVQLADALTQAPLNQQVATLNPSLSSREVFDLVYNVLGVVFPLAPVALVLYLLWQRERPHFARLGMDARHPLRDAGWGVVLALAIGIPGIGVYLASKTFGIGVTVAASGLDPHWWTIPILLLSALRSGLQEEIVVLGYLFARLRDVGWGRWPIILAAAAFRGSYHLYQGFGAFAGNFAMGMVFGWLYARTGRVWPFVIAHFVIDAAVFVGYPWAAAMWPDMFGVPH